MYKDHKAGKKTRPVVTGCNSNTRGFSNSVSDLLESVNKANETPYETISSEDSLARIERYNKKAEKIMQEGEEHLLRKVMCNRKREALQLVAGCGKLWKGKKEEREKQKGRKSKG